MIGELNTKTLLHPTRRYQMHLVLVSPGWDQAYVKASFYKETLQDSFVLTKTIMTFILNFPNHLSKKLVLYSTWPEF